MKLHFAAARRGLLAALALTIVALGAAPNLAFAANRAPTISGKPATSATVGKSYTFQPTARDPDGDKLTYSISNKPAWARLLDEHRKAHRDSGILPWRQEILEHRDQR